MNWRKITLEEKGKERATAFHLELQFCTICVHRNVRVPKQWLLTCNDVGIQGHKLESIKPKEARRESIQIVKRKLIGMKKELKEL